MTQTNAHNPMAMGSDRSASASTPDTPQAASVLEMLGTGDTAGTTCALLTPAIKAKLRELEGGQVLEVRVDDPSAREDIAAWCRLAGHELLAVVDEMPTYTRYFISKKRG
jgi:tRNA 2-thiouridine synthesizing protein A